MWDRTKTVTVQRAELHAAVWSEPMRTVAARYGISDVGLKKACVRHGIPVPRQGHWATPEAKRPAPTPLPELEDAGPVIFTVQPKTEREEQALPPDVAARVHAEEAPDHKIVVSETIRRPHAVTEATRRALKADTYGSDQRLSAWQPGAFGMTVAKPSVGRALSVVDALLKACDARSIEVRAGKEGAKHPGVVLVVDGEAIHPSLRERVRQHPHEPTAEEIADEKRYGYSSAPSFDTVPNGELVLELHVADGFWPPSGNLIRQRWTDNARRKVEYALNEVAASLLRLSAWQRQQRRERLEAERRQQEEQLRRWELERRREEEKRRLAELEAQADRWHQARRIREYVDAFEAAAAREGRLPDPGGEAARNVRVPREARRRRDGGRQSVRRPFARGTPRVEPSSRARGRGWADPGDVALTATWPSQPRRFELSHLSVARSRQSSNEAVKRLD